MSKFDPGPTPSIYQGDDDTTARSECMIYCSYPLTCSHTHIHTLVLINSMSFQYDIRMVLIAAPKKTSKRDAKAMRISQKKATDRLASQSVLEGAANILSGAKLFK